MKKKLLLVSLSVLLLMFSLSGCVAIKATNIAKQMIADYYEYFNDKDIDECVDMLSDKLVDNHGGEDSAEIIFSSGRLFLGEVEEFKVMSFDSDSNFGDAEVILQLEVQYENLDETVDEEYTFYFSDNKMRITDMQLSYKPFMDQLIDGYFKKYYDMDYVKEHYIPYVAENLFDSDAVSEIANYAKQVGGEYESYELQSTEYYYSELDWDDDIYYIMQVGADLEFENEDFTLYAEISAEDDEVGFNYLEYYPKSPYKLIRKYYDNLEAGETGKIIDMYSPMFFEYSDYTGAEWDSLVLQVLANDFGAFVGFEIQSWTYEIIDLDGVQTEVYSFNVNSEFENGLINENFTFLRNADGGSIVGHQLAVQ